MGTSFKIGTRHSPLAMKQAHMLADALQAAHPQKVFEIVPIKSNADWKKGEGEKPLSEENGGKGLFAKEIEQEIIAGTVDCGVHSLKDMASFLPQGLVINHFMPRANALDALICQNHKSLSDLPKEAVLGTCSARRKAIALSLRPDLKVVPFRGNVQTRLDKVKAGQVDATFLAMAGLERLEISDDTIHPMPDSQMLPACGQGIICMETREDDGQAWAILEAVTCPKTRLCALAEREVLRALDGSCHTPISAYAEIIGDRLHLRAEVYALDGAQVYRESCTQDCKTTQQAIMIGQSIGQTLKAVLPEGFLS